MEPKALRVALFSGNYNYVRDGANQALNRLVGYLLRQGVQVRVYSPVVEHPAFPATGDLINTPSLAIPGRAEYRVPVRIGGEAMADLKTFAPNIVHVSSPDIVAHRAVTWARKNNIPAVASVHTRFETYLKYYGLQALEPTFRAILKRFYSRCDAVLSPSPAVAEEFREWGVDSDISLWKRGVDREQFNPGRRSDDFRAKHGFAPDDMVVAFLGRLVLEKGLGAFANTVTKARTNGTPLKVLAIGDGPARDTFRQQMPDAVFMGQLTGTDLAMALASTDVFLHPSITEGFPNVTLESMACGLPAIAVAQQGGFRLVEDGRTGFLVPPNDIDGFAAALDRYAKDPALRRAHGEAGLAIAKTFDWDGVNSAVVDTYLRVAHR